MHREQPGYNILELEDGPIKVGGMDIMICTVKQWEQNSEVRRKAEEKLEQLIIEGYQPKAEKAFQSNNTQTATANLKIPNFETGIQPANSECEAYVKVLKWLLGKGL